MTGVTEQFNAMTARLRVSEERYSEIRKKLLLVEQNMLSNHKRAMEEIKHLRNDITDVKRTIQNVEDRIITVIKELRLMAPKESVDVMKRYIELWNPVKFVTEDQVQKMIDEKMGKNTPPPAPRHNYDSPS